MVSSLHEHRGKQALYQTTSPDILQNLVEVARIQSTGASNAIEGIGTTDERLKQLVLQKVEPRNRDEREIVGYRRVLATIHESYEHIPVTPGVILQLHRDLFASVGTSIGGHWKDSDNVIAERDEAGHLRARFVPTPASQVPDAVERLCAARNEALSDGTYDPLLVTCAFVFDFVSIHPFSDGNGRMSRLLTLLLLYQAGYDVGKYVSIEKAIDDTKQSYYESLAASSCGWHENCSDYLPFVSYLLGTIEWCYAELDRRMAAASTSAPTGQLVLNALRSSVAPLAKKDLLDLLPNMSQRTLERALAQLQADGLVRKTGAARATRYVLAERER